MTGPRIYPDNTAVAARPRGPRGEPTTLQKQLRAIFGDNIGPDAGLGYYADPNEPGTTENSRLKYMLDNWDKLNRVLRDKGNEPKVMQEPWADSLATALGVQPKRVQYLGNPDGRDDDEGMASGTMHGLSGSTGISKENRNVMSLRAGMPRRDWENTVAHEMRHVQQHNRTGPSLQTMSNETDAALAALGWEMWSGRPPYTQAAAQIRGVDPKMLTPSRIKDYAESLRKSYLRNKP